MNKSEHRHQLIRALVSKKQNPYPSRITSFVGRKRYPSYTGNLITRYQTMNLSKVREEDNSYYVLNTGSISKWEKRLENYMEDALVMLRPVNTRLF